MLFDIHGQAAYPDSILRGTHHGTAVKSLLARAGAPAVTGPDSVFGRFAAMSYGIVPSNDTSPTAKVEAPNYTGGHTVAIYGSHNAGGIDAMQLEFGRDLREQQVVGKTARDAAGAIAAFYESYLRGFVSFASKLLAAVFLSNAAAQPYPAKPIRLIVPATPGGGSDVPARIMTQALTDELGWKFVVDNRGGASGRIGAELAAKSPPDGYTLLVGNTTPNAVVQGAVANLPYDTLRDFAAVSLISTSDFNLVVHPSLPATNVKELVALAKSRPGEIRFGSVGNISGAHVTGELFKQLAGISITHVPYKGAALAMVALLSGEVQMYFGSGPSVAPHTRTGKVRVLATTGTKRSRFSPDVPTVSETIPGHTGMLWYGILAPAGTPKDVIATLNKSIVTAGRSPRVIDQLTAVGMESVNTTPAEFTAFIKSEIVKWGKVVKASGATAD